MHKACRRRSTRLRPALLCVAVLCSLPGPSSSAQLDYQLDATIVRSDNINLSENNEIDETVVIPRLGFDFQQEGSAVRLLARGDIEYRNYLDDSFPNETRSELAGQFNWSVLPQRLSFVLEDYLSQEPITLREGNYPGNVQRVNVFVGGPSLHARFNDVTRAQLDLRATDSDAEETEDFNGRRYTAAGTLQRELSSTSQAVLGLVSTDAEFDDPTASDFSRHDAFVGYRRNLERFNLEADAGYSRLRPDDNGDTVTSAIGRVTVGWQVTPRSQILVRGRYDLTDSVNDLIVRQGDLSEPIIPEPVDSFVFVNPAVYRQRRFEVDYRYQGDRLSLRLRPMYRRLRYIDGASSDRDVRGGYLTLGYRVRPRFSLSLQANAINREFTDLAQEDKDRVYVLGGEYQISRHWSWHAEAIRRERTSTDPEPPYKENSIQLTATWRR